MANTKDSLQAQADLLRTRMELLVVQAQLMQYQYKDLVAQLERVNTQLAAVTAPSQPDVPTEELRANPGT